MARQRPQRRLTVVGALLLAGTTSGAALSLSIFEPINSLGVPIGCSFAYDTPLRGCTRSDFGGSDSCSVQCRLYLERAEYNIQAACRDVDASPNSLMGKALHGQLADALCDEGNTQTTTTKVVVVPPKTTQETSTKQTSTKHTTHESTVTTTKKPPAETTTTETKKTTTSTTSTSTEIETTSAEQTTSAQTTLALETTTAAPHLSEATLATSTTTTEKPKDTQQSNPIAGSGGGSPGDFVSGAEAAQVSRSWTLCVAALGLAMVI